jgi:hypothetical protein
MPDPRPVLITVHGIRTFGQWQDRLKKLVTAANPNVEVKEYGYGYFSVVAFLIPVVRWLAVISFRRRLKLLLKTHPRAPVSIVAHSFGTHIVARALQSMKPGELPEIPVVILAGSVLKSNFDWTRLLNSGKLKRVINDCGIDDNILLLSQMCVLLTGMAGRVGFYGFSDEQVMNRYFAGGHSHYFQPAGADLDSFMRSRWVPILAHGTDPELPDERVTRGTIQGVGYALMRLADPIKIMAYLSIAYLLTSYAYLEPRRQVQWELARRQYQAAAGQLSDDSKLAGGVASLARLVANRALQTDDERNRALDLARFGLQRLLTREEALAEVKLGSFFHSGNGVYFKGNQLAHLDAQKPIGQMFHPSRQTTVLVSQLNGGADGNEKKVRVAAFNISTSGALAFQEIDLSGSKLNPGFKGYSIKSDPHRLLVELSTSEIEGDNSHHRIVAFDLNLKTAVDVPADDLRIHKNCGDVAWVDDEEDNKASFSKLASLFSKDPVKRSGSFEREIVSQYSSIDHSDCVSELTAWGIPALYFPRAKAESTLFSVQPKTEPVSQEGLPECESQPPDGTRRIAGTTIDFSQITFAQNEESGIGVEQVRENLGNDTCAVLLSGPKQATYVASMMVLGQWIGAWVICELRDGKQAKECRIFSFASEGGGELWYKPGSRFLIVGDAVTETNETAFILVDLVSKERIVSDSSPDGRVRFASIDPTRGVVLTASDVAGWQDATEVFAYQLVGSKLVLIGRRRFNPPIAPLTALQSDVADGAAPRLEFIGNRFVLSTASQSLVGIDPVTLPWWRRIAPEFMAPWIRDTWKDGDTIPVIWSVPFADYAPGKPSPKITSHPDKEVLAAYSEDRIRIVHSADGTTLSYIPEVEGVSQGCQAKLSAVTFDSSDRIILESPGCRIERAPPLSRKEMEQGASNLGSYLTQLD